MVYLPVASYGDLYRHWKQVYGNCLPRVFLQTHRNSEKTRWWWYKFARQFNISGGQQRTSRFKQFTTLCFHSNQRGMFACKVSTVADHFTDRKRETLINVVKLKRCYCWMRAEEGSEDSLDSPLKIYTLFFFVNRSCGMKDLKLKEVRWRWN